MDYTAALPAPTARAVNRLAPFAIAGLVLALCLALSLLLWRGAQKAEQARVQADFDFRTRELLSELTQRMSAYIQVLHGAQGLFASSNEVTRAEFSRYVAAQELELHFPGVQGLGYLALLTPGERAAHLARARRDGLPDYAIHPAGERALTAPVTYLEPGWGSNARAFGFDAWSEPTRRAGLELARDTGQATLSGSITLVQETAPRPQAGFVVALALFRPGPHATLAQRRAAICGWVYAPFRMADLVAGLGGERATDLAIEIYDGAGTGAAQRMFGAPAPGATLRAQQTIRVAQHDWTVVVGALPSFDAPAGIRRASLVGLTGLGANLTLSWLTWLLAHSRATARAALRRATELTGQLESGAARLAELADAAQRSGAMLRNILDATIDGILVDDGGHRVLAANQRFCALWSVPDTLAVGGPDQALLEHMLGQLTYPAPFLYNRSLQFVEHDEQRDVLRLNDGRLFEQFTRAIRLGGDAARLWTFRDVTERKQIEQRERSHRHVLELLARRAPLHAILDAVVLGVEATNPGMLCSVLLLDASGHHLLTGAAPSLPAFFNQAIHGVAIGPAIGSCGTAAATGERVIVEEIAGHPFWTDFAELAARARLAACWSEPIRSGTGKILGSFAIYHHEPHSPSPAHIVLIEQASQLAGIAIEQANAAQALHAGEQRFRSLYDNAPVALWEQDWSALRGELALLEYEGVTDLESHLSQHPEQARRIAAQVKVLDVNDAALAQIGALEKDLDAISLAQNFDEHALPSLIATVVALAGGAQQFACEGSFVRLDGAARQNELTLLVMPGHAHTLDFVIVSTLDITERKRIDTELLMLATTDFLTGLPNRREFMARLDDELARVQRHLDSCAGVLMLDIDHFKTVNDRYGHAVGDAVLRHLAALMRAGQRKFDTLGRVGGEEFAVLLPGADLNAAVLFAERLRQQVAQAPLAHGEQLIYVTVSIGVSNLRAGDNSADAALIRADQALYGAKAAGRNRVGADSDGAAPLALSL